MTLRRSLRGLRIPVEKSCLSAARSGRIEHMFEDLAGCDEPPEAAPEPVAPVTVEVLQSWIAWMSRLDRQVDDATRVSQLELLERLKSAAAAAQAEVTVDFVASQRAEQLAAGVPAARVGAGIGAQVALARRDSPFRGGRYVGLAQALMSELPATMAALRAGDTSEWRATLVARETACLDPADRRAADAELGPALADLGDREVEAAARAIAYRLDPQAFVDRSKGVAKDRTVTLRPAPDTMSRFCGFLPVAQGVAAHTALSREADRLTAEGDPRSRGQIMADTLVERVTGQAAADKVPVEVQLVMSAETLVAGGDKPADLVGAGPIPAAVARNLVADPDAKMWLMESKRRTFPKGLRRALQVRDRTCRTPWCGAPIRHADHVVPVSEGGTTSAANGQGLCEACNYAKQAPGWRARPGPAGAGDQVEITTPTGHTYTSHPPPLPGARAPSDDRSLIEEHFRRLLHAA
jgi:hypothetical protein